MTTKDEQFLKQIGVSAAERCLMCEAHEVREDQQREQVAHLRRANVMLDRLMRDEVKAAREMRHQRNLALFAVGCCAAGIIIAAVCR